MARAADSVLMRPDILEVVDKLCALCSNIEGGLLEQVRKQIHDERDQCLCAVQRPIYRLITFYRRHLELARKDNQSLREVWQDPRIGRSRIRSLVLESVAKLLAGGAACSYSTGIETPLMAALTCGDLDLLYTLLDFKADINQRDGSESMNALGLSILLNCPSLVELLLKHGGKVDSPCCGSLLPIQLAMNKQSAIANLLIQAGANTQPLRYFSHQGGGFDTQSPLFVAILRRNVHLARLLLEHGEDVNQAFPDNLDCPIHAAVRVMDSDMIDLLAQFGADLNKVNHERHTPLGLALHEDQEATKVAIQLIRLGANPVKKTRISFFQHAYSPLHIACFKGSFQFVQFLLEEVAPYIDLHDQTVKPSASEQSNDSSQQSNNDTTSSPSQLSNAKHAFPSTTADGQTPTKPHDRRPNNQTPQHRLASGHEDRMGGRTDDRMATGPGNRMGSRTSDRMARTDGRMATGPGNRMTTRHEDRILSRTTDRILRTTTDRMARTTDQMTSRTEKRMAAGLEDRMASRTEDQMVKISDHQMASGTNYQMARTDEITTRTDRMTTRPDGLTAVCDNQMHTTTPQPPQLENFSSNRRVEPLVLNNQPPNPTDVKPRSPIEIVLHDTFPCCVQNVEPENIVPCDDDDYVLENIDSMEKCDRGLGSSSDNAEQSQLPMWNRGLALSSDTQQSELPMWNKALVLSSDNTEESDLAMSSEQTLCSNMTKFSEQPLQSEITAFPEQSANVFSEQPLQSETTAFPEQSERPLRSDSEMIGASVFPEMIGASVFAERSEQRLQSEILIGQSVFPEHSEQPLDSEMTRLSVFPEPSENSRLSRFPERPKQASRSEMIGLSERSELSRLSRFSERSEQTLRKDDCERETFFASASNTSQHRVQDFALARENSDRIQRNHDGGTKDGVEHQTFFASVPNTSQRRIPDFALAKKNSDSRRQNNDGVGNNGVELEAPFASVPNTSQRRIQDFALVREDSDGRFQRSNDSDNGNSFMQNDGSSSSGGGERQKMFRPPTSRFGHVDCDYEEEEDDEENKESEEDEDEKEEKERDDESGGDKDENGDEENEEEKKEGMGSSIENMLRLTSELELQTTLLDNSRPHNRNFASNAPRSTGGNNLEARFPSEEISIRERNSEGRFPSSENSSQTLLVKTITYRPTGVSVMGGGGGGVVSAGVSGVTRTGVDVSDVTSMSANVNSVTSSGVDVSDVTSSSTIVSGVTSHSVSGVTSYTVDVSDVTSMSTIVSGVTSTVSDDMSVTGHFGVGGVNTGGDGGGGNNMDGAAAELPTFQVEFGSPGFYTDIEADQGREVTFTSYLHNRGQRGQSLNGDSEIQGAAGGDDHVIRRERVRRFVNQEENDGSTALFMAVYDGNLDLVNYLLSCGADSRFSCHHGNFLHAAILSQSVPLLQRGLELECDVNEINNFGNSPLTLVSRLSLSDMVVLLITHGADINSRDRFGETPLQASIYFGCQDNARILIQHGADLDTHDNNYTSALYWAVYNYRVDTIRLLLMAGAHFTPTIFNAYPRNIRAMRDQNLVTFMHHYLEQPRSLLDLTALYVRRHLAASNNGRSIFPAVNLLPVPERMRSLLRLDNCIDFLKSWKEERERDV